MSTLGASQAAPRASTRQLAAIGVILLTLMSIFGLIGPVLPADATHPTIEAQVVCAEDGSVTIEWTSRSWLQDPTNDAASGNPSIFIRFNGVKVAEGAYTAANNYEFSGSNAWPDLNVSSVNVLAYANAAFNNGDGQGTSRGRTVNLPEDCPTTTTTTAQENTTTTAQENTTTQPPVSTTQPPTVVTEPETDVLGIQVSAPEAAQVNQVTQETLPFTGISTGSMALLAAAFAGIGLLLLLAARQNDERTPVRSWNP